MSTATSAPVVESMSDTVVCPQLSRHSTSLEELYTIGYNRSHSPSCFSSAGCEEEEGQKNVLAERYKTKLCKNFVQYGTCPYDIRCMFAHGEEELRTAEMNIMDGLVTKDAITSFQKLWHRAVSALSGSKHHSSHVANRRGVMTTATTTTTAGGLTDAAMHICRPMQRVVAAAAAVPCGGRRVVSGSIRIRGRVRHNPYCHNILPTVSRYYSTMPDVFTRPYNKSDSCGNEAITEGNAGTYANEEGNEKETPAMISSGVPELTAWKRFNYVAERSQCTSVPEQNLPCADFAAIKESNNTGGNASGVDVENVDDAEHSTCSSVGNESGYFCRASRSASCGEQSQSHLKREGNEGRGEGLDMFLSL
ncbi:hypothetical protein, conserved [Trypanosoma brucei gambiense DAL972]|uniref:C3H1-type domain-containing protein n=1 Tax=Trypanosoma brucei gambiense (strain MHOM/CI/86/DAL972) TaxID=679716 RepID=C9ZNK2_TRYB9|nr:hypothetical protein, conserved [Trypanosoma brucei gambiense DAL972]CBH10980.1 hypothetical protein, conserved [Trypanosoma brucei gambiense DAL972]|eukprot:XP_011773267.1 hypothetical protein, conserved [Trypanosoma brucei gambiense DAL972]